jgi:integrase
MIFKGHTKPCRKEGNKPGAVKTASSFRVYQTMATRAVLNINQFHGIGAIGRKGRPWSLPVDKPREKVRGFMGHIYKRGNMYWIKYYRNGKPYRETTKGKNKAYAARLLKKREGEIADGKLPGVYFDKVRFDELVDAVTNDYVINNRNVKTIRKRFKHLKVEFSNMRMVDITSPIIGKYIEKRLKQKASNATINRELSALKRTFNLGAEQTPPLVDKANIPKIKLLEENNTREGFFEHDEFLAVRDALLPHLQGLASFAYKTGWRVSEITTLTWDRVDLGQGTVWLAAKNSKNKKAREIYLDDELKQILGEQWRKSAKSELPYVFLNIHGTDRVKAFYKSWDNACVKAKVGKRYFHDFRRTAVRNMVRSGIPESVAMKVSGHKTRSVFDRYNIVDENDLKMAAKTQHEYLEAKMGTIQSQLPISEVYKKKRA